jgi:hypothetical protein
MNPNVMAMCPSSAMYIWRVADGAVDLCTKLATELRDFGPQQIEIAVRRQRDLRASELDFNGARSRAPAPVPRWLFPTPRAIPPASSFDDKPRAKHTVKRARHAES